MQRNSTRAKPIAGVLLSIAFLLPVRVAFAKSFAMDEFLYAHWGWMTSQGQHAGVDFFVTHFPLIACLTSLPFRIVGSDPTAILYDRLLMAPIFALACAAALAINSRISFAAGIFAPMLLCLNAVLVGSIMEIRPDSLAIALFLAASALLLWTGKMRMPLSFLGGILLVLSVLSSEKALVYSPAILVASLVEFRGAPAEERAGVARRLCAAGCGAAAAILAVLLYLFHGNAFHFWAGEWWSYARLHESSYPSPHWLGLRMLATLVVKEPILTLLAAWAAIRMAGKAARDRGRSLWFNPVPAFLLAFLATGSASLLMQRAPFLYSQIPAAAALSMLAAAGLALICEDAAALRKGRARTLSISGIAAALLLSVATNVWAELKIASRGNSAQMQTLRTLARISAPSDCVYDNSGGAVARPHADDRYYQTDQVTRIAQAELLQERIPVAIRSRGCALMLEDIRTAGLPIPLQRFLAESYYPYMDDISVWGKRFASQDNLGSSESFFAVAAGTYFVWPTEAAGEMEIAVDGAQPTSKAFFLAKGDHAVQFRGKGSFYILWLPRNTQPFEPKSKPDRSIQTGATRE